uniref:Uncharacterized protein n=1 Tax=Alexandrium monilatum TaxID=311494 RepID=A0A7S4S7S0_9DINO
MERCLHGDAALTAPGPGQQDSGAPKPASANGAAVAATAAGDQRRPGEAQPQPPPQPPQQLLETQRLQELIREEMQGSLAQASRPMQIIINNHSEANAQQRTMNAQQPGPERCAEPPRKARSALELTPLSRLCIFSAMGLGLYVLHGQLQHQWRMAEMQRRIDANLFLRVTQLFSGPAPR